jgi:hypothetical protein
MRSGQRDGTVCFATERNQLCLGELVSLHSAAAECSLLTVSFFPEKPSTESKGEKPSCFQPQVRTILERSNRKINQPANQPTAKREHQYRLSLSGGCCDTFENTGKHFSDLAANLLGTIGAPVVHDRIIGYFRLLV